MKHGLLLLLSILLLTNVLFAQQNTGTSTYKKRVLESTEIDILSSFYHQDGDNASVTGGIGSEKLTDFAPDIIITIPLNADDILTFDVGISTYTSASSSNLNPFDISGASEDDDDDEDEDDDHNFNPEDVVGSPWVSSSGASRHDTWMSAAVTYTHNSDDRDRIWNVNGSFSREYDYNSVGLGAGYSLLSNQKNTELGVQASVYLDRWVPMYPTELYSYDRYERNLNLGFFKGITILNEAGQATNKTGNNTWRPVSDFSLIDDKKRNSYSISFSFSQILSQYAQISLFIDLVQQQGWLANPMQRVYFSDRTKFFIGNAESISNYESPSNKDVFMLADDFERLPDTRLKLPMGMRFHYYLTENFTLRSYYRYYFDDWGVKSHTINGQLPIKLSPRFTLYPGFRYYTQTAADYFSGFNEHLSTEKYYTSDYDLSEFDATQYSFGISYTDIFTSFKLGFFGLKSIDLRYNYYTRTTGLKANFAAIGFKFVMD